MINFDLSTQRDVLFTRLVPAPPRPQDGSTASSACKLPSFGKMTKNGTYPNETFWLRVVHTGSVRCSVAMFRRGTQTSRHEFCALRNILHHTGSVTEHRDRTHRSLHNICSVFTSRCTGFGMPRPVLYVFSNTGSSFHVFISGVVMLPRKS